MHPELPTLLSAVVVILAVVVYILSFMRVGSMRGKHSIQAPAMTGHPEFERAVRVQMNTVEQLVIFLPVLFLATVYFHLDAFPYLPALLGFVWVIGRFLYMQGYLAEASKRSTGFLISAVAALGLLLLAIIGLVQTYMAISAV
jgi:glutathione S-transferase